MSSKFRVNYDAIMISIMAQTSRPSNLYYFCQSRVFNKIDSIVKNVSNFFSSIKGRITSLEIPLIFPVSFVYLLLWIPADYRTYLKKLFNLNYRLRWNATQQRCRLHLIFLSAIAVM